MSYWLNVLFGITAMFGFYPQRERSCKLWKLFIPVDLQPSGRYGLQVWVVLLWCPVDLCFCDSTTNHVQYIYWSSYSNPGLWCSLFKKLYHRTQILTRNQLFFLVPLFIRVGISGNITQLVHLRSMTNECIHKQTSSTVPCWSSWFNPFIIPDAPCIEYLPKFGSFMGSILVSIPYMEHMGIEHSKISFEIFYMLRMLHALFGILNSA